MDRSVNNFVENKKAQDYQRHQAEEQAYRDRVVAAAGIYMNKLVEVTKNEYKAAYPEERGEVQEDDKGKNHYFVKMRAPAKVSDEEFAAIEAAFSKEELDQIRYGKPKAGAPSFLPSSSGAAGFFHILGFVLLIVGFIVAIVAGNAEVTDIKGNTTKEFSFTVFMSTFIIYAISGAFCFCAAELFTKLTDIVNLLKEIKNRM